MAPTFRIGVHPGADRIPARLRLALTSLTSAEFVDVPDLRLTKDVAGIISISGDYSQLTPLLETPLPSFHQIEGNWHPVADGQKNESVQFGNSNLLHQVFRNRSVRHTPLSRVSPLRLEAGDEVLAFLGPDPVWLLRSGPKGNLNICSVPLPQPTLDFQVFDFLNGYTFLQVLPLLHFIRSLNSRRMWVFPPLRACLMFDDPNLHRPTYGFLPYAEIIARAKRENFHVAFATVPLDGWGLHRPTVSLLRENRRHLSLLIHGNDHTREELAHAESNQESVRLLAQSLRRISSLEARTGLTVNRVMVPPHEALASTVMDTLLPLGFEGACLTPWSLRHWNPGKKWRPDFGLTPAELVDHGLPILPRFAMNSLAEGPVVISAFLGMPIVLVEHHQAMAGGLDLLSEAARMVNSLGAIEWCDARTMLRSNYLSLQDGSRLWVKPFSCKALIRIPSGVYELALDPDEFDPFNGGRAFTISSNPTLEVNPELLTPGQAVSVAPESTVEITRVGFAKVNYGHVEKLTLSLPALSRRILCEARDRLMAALPARGKGPRETKLAKDSCLRLLRSF